MAAAEILAAVERSLADHFGQRPVRASVSFVGVEAIDVLRFEPIPDERAYVTLGMSRAPMTSATEVALTPVGPRAELMVHVRDGADLFTDLWRQLAVLAAAPAVEGVVYREGMTVDLGRPFAAGSRCTGGVVLDAVLEPIVIDAEGEGGGSQTVTVLQVVPATSTELAWCRVRGVTALRERWEEDDVDLLDLSRPAVTLR